MTGPCIGFHSGRCCRQCKYCMLYLKIISHSNRAHLKAISVSLKIWWMHTMLWWHTMQLHSTSCNCNEGPQRSVSIISPALFHHSDLLWRWIATLCWGINALFPCPWCLIPNGQQSNLENKWEEHTVIKMQEVYVKALNAYNLGQKPLSEELLKLMGLHPIKVSVSHSSNSHWSLQLECLVGFLPYRHISGTIIRHTPHTLAGTVWHTLMEASTWCIGRPWWTTSA